MNNLLFLNLYDNKIQEIENLINVPKLRALLLGKNLIEKIKGLSCLTMLEVLDLHSNKIKQIENLNTLTKLRIVNLANNQLTSFIELLVNKELEEINLRKNLIVSIPNLENNWVKMKKINLAKNMITKIEFLDTFRKLNSLQELYIEDNPVLSTSDSFQKLLSFPVRFRDQNNYQKFQSLKNQLTNNKQKEDFKTILPSKNSNDDLPEEEREKRINKIRAEWEKEYQFIVSNGFNGYNTKKIKETKMQLCHVEIEGEHTLNLYGNAIEVLTYEELYNIHVKRARNILNVAIKNEDDYLILGAFGCGAFRNNPEIVAKAYKDVLQDYMYCFKVIDFAIIDGKYSNNYEIFKRILL